MSIFASGCLLKEYANMEFDVIYFKWNVIRNKQSISNFFHCSA